jgi:rfaE bifunctional protein kinase chain/domain
MTSLAERYRRLNLAVVGDFCLDRYYEIDPARQERSIETSRVVHNVVRVRSQPGAAGTIVNNLMALGVGAIHIVGFAGTDGEGYELRRALAGLPGVRMDHFLETDERRTFTYGKPLLVYADRPPVELDRLDTKNWTPTPDVVQDRLIAAVESLAENVDAFILMEQVDEAETGVVTRRLRDAVGAIAQRRPKLLVLADSRRGLGDYPPLNFKMNRDELESLVGAEEDLDLPEVHRAAAELATLTGRTVFVTLSEEGLLGATPAGEVEHVPALPVRGPIDIVGAGDAVTANLTTALASGATLREALTRANAAASIVIHQLGTTGTATVEQIEQLLQGAGEGSSAPL